MDSPFKDSPEDLNALRYSVKDWLQKAQEAVWSFHEDRDHSFLRDSDVDSDGRGKKSLTTTARCCMALAYAERHLGENQNAPGGGWRDEAMQFFANAGLEENKEDRTILEPPDSEEKKNLLNNFELAHLSDFFFLDQLNKRFPPNKEKDPMAIWPGNFEPNFEQRLRRTLQKNLSRKQPQEKNLLEGQVFFDKGNDASKHFFVTLHNLRALEILNSPQPLPEDDQKELTKNAKQFCIKQFYYSERSLQHLQDPAGLAFAGSVYCMLEKEIDRELVLTFTQTLAKFQRMSGNWATTHPIIRDNQVPWYIASQELGLSLTWLYFQPQVPDSARILLLKMMEKHFRNWLIPTFKEISGKNGRQFSGWYDDAAAGQKKVVGWATGIACHFLSNYLSVLDDHINRRVIETLNLQVPSKRYLIDNTLPDNNPKWSENQNKNPSSMINWPDLPPITGSKKAVSDQDFHQILLRNWTDPTPNSELSKKLAKHVLVPIKNRFSQTPKEFISGILSGPPGTRKTSLVRAISEIIEWPFIPVPASVIFDKGFDMMEARATEVFTKLNYLTQCVIFFDEFEEFFRERKKQQNNCKETKEKENGAPENNERSTIHDRTIAAFTTSAMLPRIQDLHDQERCLIFLATNHLTEIDEAIVRQGRFDFEEEINHPKHLRFTGEGGNYFKRPTDRTLKDLEVNFNQETGQILDNQSGSGKLKKIKQRIKYILNLKIVKNALLESSFQENIKNYEKNESLAPDQWGEARIPFKVVEKIARELTLAERKGANAFDAREQAKNEVLLLIKKMNIEKGPGPLPEIE